MLVLLPNIAKSTLVNSQGRNMTQYEKVEPFGDAE